MGGKTWTKDDLKFLEDSYLTQSYAEIAVILQRSAHSIQSKCTKLGYNKNNNINVGDKYNLLTIEYVYNIDDVIWIKCKCDCGNIVDKKWKNVQAGSPKSCGCLKSVNRTGKGTKHGLTGHPLFGVWTRMRSKCYNPQYHRYEDGLEVYTEWKDNFQPFYDWAIANGWQEKLKLERKDLTLGFTPNNCIFLTSKHAREKYADSAIETNIEKFGYEHQSQRPEERKRIKQRWSNNRQEMTDSIKKGMQDKYGVDNVFQLKNIQDKIKQTHLTKRGVEYPAQDPNVNKKMVVTKLKTGSIPQYLGKTMNDWIDELKISKNTLRDRIKKFGFEKAVTMDKRITSIEQIMKNFLELYQIKFEFQYNINRKFADFLVNDSIIIECDGLYWHCDDILKDKYYHKNRQQLFKEAGYPTLFFRSDEIENKMPIIESMILNKLNMNQNKIYGRKCILSEVNKKDAQSFFTDNHLMGKGQGKCLGLYYNEELVCAIQYTNREKYIDISRFCCKKKHHRNWWLL